MWKGPNILVPGSFWVICDNAWKTGSWWSGWARGMLRGSASHQRLSSCINWRGDEIYRYRLIFCVLEEWCKWVFPFSNPALASRWTGQVEVAVSLEEEDGLEAEAMMQQTRSSSWWEFRQRNQPGLMKEIHNHYCLTTQTKNRWVKGGNFLRGFTFLIYHRHYRSY